MKLRSVVERRLLVNYRLDPDVAAELLPAPFRPQLANGYAVAGICLIRLGQTRPAGVPAALGIRSENAAHRFAVEWDGGEGVYIPVRHTANRFNRLAGDRVFPGLHESAAFTVEEAQERLHVAFEGSESVSVTGEVVDELPHSELFANLDEASRFLARGRDGYSPTRDGEPDGLRLTTDGWRVEPLRVTDVHSSYYERLGAQFDCALVMRGVPVTWEALGTLPAFARHASSRGRAA